MESPEPKPRLRPRISLLSLLLLLSFAAMVALAFRQAIDIRNRQAEIDLLLDELLRMRIETKQLQVDDLSLVNAVGVGRPEKARMAWRLYVPPGGRYRLVYQWLNLPPIGLPDVGTPSAEDLKFNRVVPRTPGSNGRGGLKMGSGEYLAAFDIARDQELRLDVQPVRSSPWTISAQERDSEAGGWGGGFIGSLASSVPSSDGLQLSSGSVEDGEQVTATLGEKIVLLDTRKEPNPSEGLLIWIEPLP